MPTATTLTKQADEQLAHRKFKSRRHIWVYHHSLSYCHGESVRGNASAMYVNPLATYAFCQTFASNVIRFLARDDPPCGVVNNPQ